MPRDERGLVNELQELAAVSRVILYALMGVIGFLTLVIGWAQVGIIRGKPFKNPDGTADDWREQKIFYGIAVADLTVACPLSLVSLGLTFAAPKLGLFLLGGVSVWLVWSNVMTTVTSLRFEKPPITVEWLIVFPFGAAVGLAYLAWILVHFDTIYS